MPADTPGVRVGQLFKKMGLRGSPTGELVLEDVVVPAANRLAAEGQGFTVAMRALDSGRIGISGQALGIAQAAVDESRALLMEREAQQGDEFMLADMATRLESARLLAYHAAWLCSAGRPFTRQASMAKLHCTDTAMDLALNGAQLAGEEGAFGGSPFERHVRDAKALQIYEGSNQVQRIVIAREILSKVCGQAAPRPCNLRHGLRLLGRADRDSGHDPRARPGQGRPSSGRDRREG